MKKFNLKEGGIKKMLTKDEMKKISGGYTCAEVRWEGSWQECVVFYGGHIVNHWNEECGEYVSCDKN